MDRPALPRTAAAGAFLAAALVALSAAAQPPARGGGKDDAFAADRADFHYLLEHRDTITRRVKELETGVETLTESTSPEVAAKLREHAEAMHRRLKDGRPIHLRDPLFAALFRNAGKIEMTVEATEKGVRVRETSADAETVRLIQAHARVVTAFVENGHAEVRRNHDVPKPAGSKPKLEYPLVKGHGGVVDVPGGAEPPRAKAKVLVDLTTGEAKDGVNTGLDKVARFVNLYAAGGVKGDAVRFTVVVHGDAVAAVLAAPDNKANLALIRGLREAGVEFLVCGQGLAHKGHNPKEVSDQVAVATSAVTALVNRQADGYAYVPLK